MTNHIRVFVLIALIAFPCYSAMAQLVFEIDSLAFLHYDAFDDNDLWGKRLLYQKGPDVFIFGSLTNISNHPIILDYSEVDDNNRITYRELQLFIAYHYKKDYCFVQNPLYVSDIMSFPCLGGMELPMNLVKMNGKDIVYSIIGVGESFPLAFETLSLPVEDTISITSFDLDNTIRQKRISRHQRKVSKAITSSIKVIPIIHNSIDSLEIDQLRDYLLQQPGDERLNDFESSVPQSLLDRKPYYVEGGITGFTQWIREKLEVNRPRFSRKEREIILSFVVNMSGDVVYCKVSYITPTDDSKEIEDIFNQILLSSPKWEAGELHGNKINARLTLMVSIDNEGEIVDLSISP